MTDDPWQDPEWLRNADRALEELVPMIDSSAYCVSIVPRKPEDRTDIKFCLELGMMIMLDKPIIMIVPPGTKIPDKVIRVADRIVELDDPADPSFQKRLFAIMQELDAETGRATP